MALEMSDGSIAQPKVFQSKIHFKETRYKRDEI